MIPMIFIGIILNSMGVLEGQMLFWYAVALIVEFVWD
jgi:hypothetical protein